VIVSVGLSGMRHEAILTSRSGIFIEDLYLMFSPIRGMILGSYTLFNKMPCVFLKSPRSARNPKPDWWQIKQKLVLTGKFCEFLVESTSATSGNCRDSCRSR
jgi:hypothetical protein